jgi:hypothetical protein
MLSKLLFCASLSLVLLWPVKSDRQHDYKKEAATVLRKQVLSEAAWALKQQPITVTASSCPRSAGGKHDFYSEGDYWWPNPVSADSAYIQRDGMTNPQNFVAHRLAMIRFSQVIGALASAYKLTGDKKYVLHAVKHLKAWFVDSGTLMNPNLQFAQAIKGRATGRGIGIIDTIQLMEAAQGVIVMQGSPAFSKVALVGIKKWFTDYLTWLTTSKFGNDEKNAKNNHGTCWTMQVASFAKLTGDKQLLAFCEDRFKTVLLPGQMATDGSFPLELARTKPYGYSLFNLDAMVMLCQILSNKTSNLYAFTTSDGRSMQKAIAWMEPYITDKAKWPFKQDVMYWEFWPVAQPSLLFGAAACNKPGWFTTWKKLDHHPAEPEVIRNLPVRHPLIWF